MTRSEELHNLYGGDPLRDEVINELLYVESMLDQLRSLPKIKVHPEDPTRQKPTVAGKQYKEYLQQYTMLIRILMKQTGADEDADEDSPLRQWMKQHVDT